MQHKNLRLIKTDGINTVLNQITRAFRNFCLKSQCKNKPVKISTTAWQASTQNATDIIISHARE